MPPTITMKTDATVIIIGGGVIGALIARELTKYECPVILLEKENDVAAGTSKANSGIVHAGFDAKQGSNKAKFNIRGSEMMEALCKELGVKFRRNGSMVLAFDAGQSEGQEILYKQGLLNGVKGLHIISGQEARAIEPQLSNEVKTVLLAKTGAVVCPYTLTANAAENAVKNGAEIYRGCAVTAIKKENAKFILSTTQGEFSCKYVINAAGVYADKIASLAGDNSFSIYPRRGEYMLFDKKNSSLVSHTIFQMPVKGFGKGILITPTADGNLLIGPNAFNMERHQKGETQTTPEAQEEILIKAKKSIPAISTQGLITSFAGLRAISDTDDFIIKQSGNVENLIHAAGMQSPGLSAAPFVAKYIASLVSGLENGLPENKSFDPYVDKKHEITSLPLEMLQTLIEKNPAYGNIICRCETVSEGQIIDSIKCMCGALDIDGVKRRTRAGMGRCQGGFCMPKVLEIIAKETQQEYTRITKKGRDSVVLSGKKG